MAIRLEGSFATVVHQVPPRARLESTFATVVHQVPPRGRLEATFATVVHESGDIYPGDPEPPGPGGGSLFTYPPPEQVDAVGYPDTVQSSLLAYPIVLAATVLTVAASGGQFLADQYGELPTNPSGVYLDPYTGEYLLVDPGYAVGAQVGSLALYGIPAATVAGNPASKRRSGFDQLDLATGASSGHALFDLTGQAHTFLGRVEQQVDPGIENLFFGVDPEDNRWGLQVLGKNSFEVRFFEDSTLRTNPAVNAPAAYGTGKTYTVSGSANSDGDTSITTWDAAGTQIGTNSANWAGGVVSLEGSYALGRARAVDLGGFVSGNVAAFVLWDGSVQSAAIVASVEAALRTGADIDDVKVTYGASYGCDGVITGTYSRLAVEQLITAQGAGAALVASSQQAIGTYTQAADLEGLLGDWDAYREATYDGTAKLQGITDFSGNGRDLVVRETVAPEHVASSCTMLGRSVTLPGRGTSAVANYAEYPLTGTLDDFTLCFIVPTFQDGTTTAGDDTLFSIGHPTAAANLTLRTDATNENLLHAIDHTGAVVASIDTGYASSNGAAANAIVFLRRTGGQMTWNCWHFEDDGGVVTEETPVVFSDGTFRPSFTLDGIAFGGLIDGAGGHWSGLLHRCVMYDRALTNTEVDDLAASFAGRLGLSGVGTPLARPPRGVVVTSFGDLVTTVSGDTVVRN
jgi:hypothetical protein